MTIQTKKYPEKEAANLWIDTVFRNFSVEKQRKVRILLWTYGPSNHLLNNAIICLKAGRHLPT